MRTKKSKDIVSTDKTSSIAKPTKAGWLKQLKSFGKLVPPLTLALRLGLSFQAIPKNIPPQLPHSCSEVKEYVKVLGMEVGRVTKSCPMPEPSNQAET